MLEIDITYLINDRDPSDFSASIAERGANADKETWRNAKEEAATTPLLRNDKQRDEARAYFKEFGAWDDDEIAAWSNEDLDALVIQYASGDIRELPTNSIGDIDWKEAECLAEKGKIGGRIFKGNDERVYIDLSN